MFRQRLLVLGLFVSACSSAGTPLPGAGGADAQEASVDAAVRDAATNRDTATSPDGAVSGDAAADARSIVDAIADVAPGADVTPDVDGSPTMDAPAVDPITDGAPADRPADLPADVGSTLDGGGDVAAPAAAFAAYLDGWQAVYAGRLVACFHASAEALAVAGAPETTELGPSLRLGLATFDPAAAEACLGALRAGSCDEILALGYADFDGWRAGFPACKGVVTGLRGSGATCLAHVDCSTPGEACFGDLACGGPTCVADLPPPPLGAPCENLRCAADAVCGPNPLPGGPEQCHLRGTDGALCDADTTCASGFYCSFAGLGDALGACRAIKVGGACNGSWGCPARLACLGAGAGKMGKCQAGRGTGEPCTVQGVDESGNVFHECATSLVCADSDGSGPHCVAGSRIGGRCGALPVTGNTLALVRCLEGFCDYGGPAADPAYGTCRAPHAQGEACTADPECAQGLVCGHASTGAGATCAPPGPPPPIGSPCAAAAEGCAEGDYCRPASEGAETGTCQPRKATGDTCIDHVDQCEALSGCQDGVCTRC
jgi:hypothetical protein